MFEYLGGASYMDGPKTAITMILIIMIGVLVFELIKLIKR